MRGGTSSRTIKMLLNRRNGGHSSAAGKLDMLGRLPLHHAVVSRRQYDNAIKAIIKAAPQALEIKDGITHLYPFMMAAVGKDSDIDLIYRLLAEAPGLMEPLVAQTEKKNQQISTWRMFHYFEAIPMWILLPLVAVTLNIIAEIICNRLKF